MTPEQFAHFGDSITATLSEHFDGFVLVGFIAGTGQAIRIKPMPMDDKTRLALYTILVGATQEMSLPCG
jgi:hypothetical protein